MNQRTLHHNVIMRTTFTPAPDIADRLYDLARKSKKSLNVIVNELLRKGLREENGVKEPIKKYDVEPLRLKLRPGIDEDRLSKVAQEMDDEEMIKRHDHS